MIFLFGVTLNWIQEGMEEYDFFCWNEWYFEDDEKITSEIKLKFTWYRWYVLMMVLSRVHTLINDRKIVFSLRLSSIR
jgi:hypothetical protein